MKASNAIELRKLAGEHLVESMARELEGGLRDDTQWRSQFAAPGPKAAPRWATRFTAAGGKDARLRG